MDYRTLDLSSFCNVGREWLKEDNSPWNPPVPEIEAGRRILRGIPFQFGSGDPKTSFLLGFGPGGLDAPVAVPIGGHPGWVIVAHRQEETGIHEGEPPGGEVCRYRFRFGRGGEEEAVCRERFEIGRPPAVGSFPFLAESDSEDYLVPRTAGEWEQMGWRLTEGKMGVPRHFFLWVWRNPRSGEELESLVIVPCRRRFTVGAVTLSFLDERPFAYPPRIPVRIRITDPELARGRFDLGLEVDRGVAGYPRPLTESQDGEDTVGFGAKRANRNSPAYVEVAASPSAELSVRSGARDVGRLRWREVLDSGSAEGGHVRIESLDRGRNWVHTQVLDAETGRPVPCRVHFRSPEGIPYQPHGHHNHIVDDAENWSVDVGGDVRLGDRYFAYIDGRCQGWLPRGRVLVEVARGFEYEPLGKEVEILPGQRELTLTIRRWANLNRERWFSGDTHVHFLAASGAHLEAQAEDLNVVNLLQSQWGHLFSNVEDFLGRPVSSPDGRTIVYTSQENRQHMLGHLTLLGLKSPVMPFCSDGAAEAEIGGSLETTMSDWADRCHQQGGVVVLPHFPWPNTEPAALIATGRVDAVEMVVHSMAAHHEYYRYLNGGYRLPLVGGTDKMTTDVPVGLYRTYVHVPADEEFNYSNWCRNLTLGRTFLSSGPILRFSVDGARVGDTIRVGTGGGSVEVRAEAESVLPIHRLEVVCNGDVVASTEERGGARRLSLAATLRLTCDSWLAARVSGPGYSEPFLHHDGWRRGIMAHTSPVYVSRGRKWSRFDPNTANYMLTLLHGGLEYVRRRSESDPGEKVTRHHHHHDHRAFLERPFHEAIAEVEKRLRKHPRRRS